MGGTPPSTTPVPVGVPAPRRHRHRRSSPVAPVAGRALTASAVLAGVVGAVLASRPATPEPSAAPSADPADPAVRPAGDRAVSVPAPRDAGVAVVPVPPVAAREATRPKSTAAAARPAPRPAAPAPDAATGVAGALFDSARGDFASHFDNSGNSGLVENGRRPSVVGDALAFSLGSGGKRSEVLPEGPGTRPRDGDQQYVRYSAVLGAGFPTDTDQWQVILQWHHTSADGSPPLSLEISDGQLKMVSGGDEEKVIGPVRPGQRIDLTMKVRFSQDPSRGAVTVWRDGRPTGVTDWRPSGGTLSTPTAYLKMGYYRSTRITQPGSFTVTDLKIAPTPAGVL